MPKFYKNRRYVNKQGKKFGKGVWVDDDGTIIYPGQGKTLDRKNSTITQYNSDGTKTTYPWEHWAKKNQTDHEVRVLQNDRKYAIPVVPEKMMTITLDEDSPTRHAAGATFSENLLDSIAVNAKKAGLPFSTGLGMASQESALSQGERGEGKSMLPWNRLLNASTGEVKKNARNISYDGYYSPSLLISNWKQRQEGPFYKYNYNSQGYLLDSPKNDEFYDADINAARREANKYHLEEESPLEHGFRKYKEDPTSWNPKDPDYPKKVKEKAEELTKYSPEIRAYMQKNNLHAEGGYLDTPWNELPISMRAEIMREAVNNGIYNLQDVRDAYHNNLFGGGGYIPSKAIKQRIAEWEGSSMYKAAPDTGKVNRSFEAEAKDFNRVIPASIRAKLSQEQLDALYSYGYNVGMGNLKQRVLPTLTSYINGSAGAEDVASSMWASRDNEPKMGGLRRRRAYERNQFIYGSPSEKRQSVVTSALNMDLSNLPSELSQEDLQQLYLANPTDYGTPVDYSTPTKPVVEAPIEEDYTQPSGMGIFNLMSNLGMFGNIKQEAPIASYTPTKNSNPYVVSMPTNNSTLLDASWFAEGGPIDLGYNSKAYEEWKASLPKNLRKETPEYDLYGAYKTGLKPHLEEDGYYHLGSRDPKTNRLLKKPSHPTYPLAILADAQEGYLASPYDKKIDSVYTYPLPWIKCNGGHLFNDGGDTITDAASGNVYYGVEDVVSPNQLVVNPDGSVTTVNGVTGAVNLPATTITGYRNTDDRIKAALNNIVKENPAQISSIPSIALSATGDLIKGGANAVVNAFGLPDVAPASNPAEVRDGDALLDYVSVVTPAAKANIFRPLTFSRNKVTKAVEGTPSFTGFSVSSPIYNDVILGRRAFLQDVSSPWYKERWINAGVDERTTDRILADMYKQAEDASFDLSKNAKQLGNNYGLTIRKPEEVTTKLDPNGNVLWKTTNYDTGMEDIRIAIDAPKKANTTYHELLHYTTNNSSGSSLNNFTITPKDMLDVYTDVFPSSHHTLRRGSKVYQDFIADQNERLLPPRSAYYQLAWEKPEEFKEVLINKGRTPAQAERRLKEALAESEYMWKIQEQRSHLKTWFRDKIQPHLKNPNDPAEIEQYFNDNPDVIKRAPSEVKQVMTELRPGSIKDYSKYFAESLSVAPFILTSNND